MEINKWLKIITLILVLTSYLLCYFGKLNIRLNLFIISLLIGILNFLYAFSFYNDEFRNRKKRAYLCIIVGVTFIIISFVNLIIFLK